MSPMKKDRHEEILNSLNDPDLNHTDRAELLQELRTDYTGVHTDFEDLSSTTKKLQSEKDDLVVSNSKLFRQLGTDDNEETNEEEEKKSFSEEVTIESLEQRA